jgi:hypothetical protein
MPMPRRSTRSNTTMVAPQWSKPKKASERCYSKETQLVYEFGTSRNHTDVLVRLDSVESAGVTEGETCPIWYERFQDVELEIAPGPYCIPEPICLELLMFAKRTESRCHSSRKDISEATARHLCCHAAMRTSLLCAGHHVPFRHFRHEMSSVQRWSTQTRECKLHTASF